MISAAIALVALGERGERELLREVVVERGLGGGELGEVVAVVVAARARPPISSPSTGISSPRSARSSARFLRCAPAALGASGSPAARRHRAATPGSSCEARSARSSSGFSAR